MRELVKNLPFWDNLSDGEKEFTEQNSVVRSYAKGTMLKSCGDACLGMIYVLGGSLRALMVSEEGREITLFRLHAGDSGILSASCVLSQITFETELVTEEPTRLLVLNSEAFGRLIERNIEVRCFSYELVAERSSAVIWVLQQIIFAKFDRRLASFLLRTCEQTGSDELKMSKEAIAREVNTAREVVSRMLREFSEGGLIRMNQKTITIVDKRALRELLK